MRWGCSRPPCWQRCLGHDLGEGRSLGVPGEAQGVVLLDKPLDPDEELLRGRASSRGAVSPVQTTGRNSNAFLGDADYYPSYL